MERIKRYLVIGAYSETGMDFLRLFEKREQTGLVPENI